MIDSICLAENVSKDTIVSNMYTCFRGYKTFFMLNSAEHEILNVHKYKKFQALFQHFSDSDKSTMLFFLLIC